MTYSKQQQLGRLDNKRLIIELDRMVSEMVKSRDQCCMRCGRSGLLDWSHIISRRYKHLRWDYDNSFALCRACHLYFWHRGGPEVGLWFQLRLPKCYANWLKNINDRNIHKVNIIDVYGKVKTDYDNYKHGLFKLLPLS